jgi:hypothetical protein
VLSTTNVITPNETARSAQLLESDDHGFRLLASRALECPQIMIPVIRLSFDRGISTGRFDQHEPFHPAAFARHVIDNLECNRWLT